MKQPHQISNNNNIASNVHQVPQMSVSLPMAN